MKRIAEELATECVTDASLNELYKEHGMHLMAARKTGNRIEVYTKLRIIG